MENKSKQARVNTRRESIRAKGNWALVKRSLQLGLLAKTTTFKQPGGRAKRRFLYVMRRPPADRTESMLEAIRPFAMSLSFFEEAGSEQTMDLLRRCTLRQYDDHDMVFEQGDPGDHFYIIVAGSVEIFVKLNSRRRNKPHLVLHRGDSFGEFALLQDDCKRQGAARGRGRPCQLLEVSRFDYHDTVLKHREKNRDSIYAVMHNSMVQQHCRLTSEDMQELVKLGSTRRLPIGFVLQRQGCPCGDLCMVLRGELEATMQVSGQHVRRAQTLQLPRICAGDVVGALAGAAPLVMHGVKARNHLPDEKAFHDAQVNATATTPVKILVLPRLILRKKLDTKLRDAFAQFAVSSTRTLERTVAHLLNLEERVTRWRKYCDHVHSTGTYRTSTLRPSKRATTKGRRRNSNGRQAKVSMKTGISQERMVVNLPPLAQHVLARRKEELRDSWRGKMPILSPQNNLGLQPGPNGMQLPKLFHTPHVTPLPSRRNSAVAWDFPGE